MGRGKPYPPLATLQVAALLRERGHAVSLFDAMLADDVEDYTAALCAAQPALVVFYEDNFNFLTKMCLSRMREAACRMIGRPAPPAAACWWPARMPPTIRMHSWPQARMRC